MHQNFSKPDERIKNVPYKVKATQAKQPVLKIEVEDDLAIGDDDDLDLIDRGDI